MEVSESLSPDYYHPGSSQAAYTKSTNNNISGLKLVLPPLKGLKPVKVGKKTKRNGVNTESGAQDGDRKIPRPVKLKPLKEVLTKLITQIKKKDDYAFFLQPVDILQTPGYTDIVKRPMDFGTMSLKVSKGKYRSLEEFASDLRLVTSNAKIFNPPGTIYHTEADKIEAWGLDHISKAAITVIQYETDWNIEIEKDDEGTVNVDDDDDDFNAGTPMDTEDPATGGRSPSVASQAHPAPGRRGARGPYKKNANSNTLAESIDAEGRLPGSKDGLGSFPPCSDWAQMMLALKLKGKRYRTKRERMRIEKEGPPLLADGSLDYTEMEDPFSFLSVLTPDVQSRPSLVPLYPPLFPSNEYEPSSSQSQPPPPPVAFPTSVNLSFDHSPGRPTSIPDLPVTNQRRHWVISRNGSRAKGKEKDDEQEFPDVPTWRQPREAHASDFGSFAYLAGALEDEIRRRSIIGKEGEEEEKIHATIRSSVSIDAATNEIGTPEPDSSSPGDYWSTKHATIAEDYIRDIVYGGIDGLAYIRSLAEFVAIEQQPVYHASDREASLAAWVETNLVDTLTGGRHALLRTAALELTLQSPSSSIHDPSHSIDRKNMPIDPDVTAQVANSLHVYPQATAALSALRQIKTHKIDMGALIKTPGELFLSEEEWFGKIFRERRKPRGEEKLSGCFEVEEPERTWMDVDASAKDANGNVQDSDYELEGPEELNEVLDYVASVITTLDKKLRDQRTSQIPVAKTTTTTTTAQHILLSHTEAQKNGNGKSETFLGSEPSTEDPVLRNLRLNLLALAKRAPLDTIARLPKDLVPEHIRHFVPTLGASG